MGGTLLWTLQLSSELVVELLKRTLRREIEPVWVWHHSTIAKVPMATPTSTNASCKGATLNAMFFVLFCIVLLVFTSHLLQIEITTMTERVLARSSKCQLVACHSQASDTVSRSLFIRFHILYQAEIAGSTWSWAIRLYEYRVDMLSDSQAYESSVLFSLLASWTWLIAKYAKTVGGLGTVVDW